MIDLPPLATLASVDPARLYGLLDERGRGALGGEFEFAWERDRALRVAVIEALRAVASGASAQPATRPRWLSGLVARELKFLSERSRWDTNGEHFALVRLLERLGLVEVEPDDIYVLALVSGLGDDKQRKLRADPELVERALWRVFEVEGGGEVSLTNVDRFGQDDWRKTFVAMVHDGDLDRSRVLAACLDALARDFAAYRASWYSGTFLALEPTVGELRELQTRLVRLFSSTLPVTVAFAVKLASQLQKASALDVGAALDALPPATLVKTKGTAVQALRLAKSAGVNHRERVLEIARGALDHPNADVQRAALDMITALGDGRSGLGEIDRLSPALLTELGLEANEAHQPEMSPSEQTVARIPTPVGAADLAERAAALLESCADQMELEAVLAAIGPGDLDEQLRPLAKRARAIVARGEATSWGGCWLPGQFARLILTRLGERTEHQSPHHPALRFVAQRIRDIADHPGAVLATPDLDGGWISAEALARRLRESPAPRQSDLIAALLRLHPEGRDQVPTEGLPPSVRFALTDRMPDGAGSESEALMLAARRSRGPYEDAEKPGLSGRVYDYRWQAYGKNGVTWYAKYELKLPAGSVPGDDRPTEPTTANPLHLGGGFLGDWIPAAAAVWPHDAEHFLTINTSQSLQAPTSGQVEHDLSRVLDALAHHPGRMGTLAVHTLAAGLSGPTRTDRLHAVDAYVDLVPTGRIAPNELASALAASAEAWPATRWVETLRAAALAPGTRGSVIDLLTLLLPKLPEGHRGLAGLLEVLHEEIIRSGSFVTDPALRSWLEGQAGSSKAAKTARALLERR